MRNTIVKSGTTHTEGETNTRKCKSAHSGRILKVGEGFKVVGLGTYKFIHESERMSYLQNLTVPKKYLHGMEWLVTVSTKRADIESLSLLGWTIAQDTATRKCNTLNLFKALKGLKGFNASVDLQTENGKEKKLRFGNINYMTLRTKVILETKRLLAEEKYGKEVASKRVFNDFPDFLNI